jgi:hypothetical protein
VRGPGLSPLRCRKNGPDVEAIPGGKILADAPNFIDYGVPGHKLFSHEFFRCSDDRAVIPVVPADQGKCPGVRRIRNVHAIPRHQEIHSMHRCDGDVRSVRRGLARDFAGSQDAGG